MTVAISMAVVGQFDDRILVRESARAGTAELGDVEVLTRGRCGGRLRPSATSARGVEVRRTGRGLGGEYAATAASPGAGGLLPALRSLWHPDTVYDLRAASLREASQEWVPRVCDVRGANPEFLEECRRRDVIDLCLWCPAHQALEARAWATGWSTSARSRTRGRWRWADRPSARRAESHCAEPCRTNERTPQSTTVHPRVRRVVRVPVESHSVV
jgi:hypothetical protein